MRHSLALAALAATALSAPAFVAPAFAQDDPAAGVSADRLRSDVERMVAFGTRHTLSGYDNPVRGIGAALDWGKAAFDEASATCGGCLETRFIETEATGRRIPEPVLIRDAIAIQRGFERPNEVIIIQGHIDSRGSDVMDAQVEAPGANDNASGSALVLEAARVMSGHRYPTTIVYALLAGEEQGLYGGQLLADYAREQGWTVKAVFNNDIVGGSCGSDGVCDNTHVRIFSEDIRADADDAMRARMRSMGGANDSPSRNLSRFVSTIAGEYESGLGVRQTFRSDRMGRGGDHIPFLESGFPAIRFSVAIEDYQHQHQDLRVEDGVTYGDTVDEMDFDYLANVTRLNVRAADVLAHAPMPPVIQIDGVVRPDVQLEWLPVEGAARYNVWRRATDARDWVLRETLVADPGADLNSITLAPDRGDDWIFGVSAVAANGAESPVASAVPGGDFYPLPAPVAAE
ncbi:M28 family peptidase [Erythrobacter arachoides]|uniref:M28 family peptidase n=1 Tax=Aurantiacibacter arachoides TaxID=1850444 RepID=A0A844ZYG3_9SPHN|nr:M28 family peptidase [Aurantiacibacter arachoides]MXO93193.1 M28 family peptidase [Aurantiacibacter arachoides]GGD51294.1 peptidase M28 [Aurantiacibacter arachoides]